MKFLLFRPNSEVINALPPLGFLSLAAYLREKEGHEIRIYDGRLHCAALNDYIQQVEHFQPDFVGIGLLSIERLVGHQALSRIRKNFPGVTTVMGGPYATSETNDAMQNPDLDFLVMGEGEIVAQNLLRMLNQRGDFSEVKGIAFRRNGEIVVNPREETMEDLDQIPMNARVLVNLPDYHHGRGRLVHMNIHKKFNESAPIMTSRGCPYQCTPTATTSLEENSASVALPIPCWNCNT